MVALFVVLTFILFVVIDLIILKAQRKNYTAVEGSTKAVFNKKSLHLPANLFISKGHTWAQRIEDGLVKIGIDEFVLKALGKISVSNMVQEQTVVRQGDVIMEGMSGNTRFQFRSPLDGTVKLVNRNLKIIEDPYQKDWGMVVVPSNWDNNVKSLNTGLAVVNWMKEEFSRLKDFLSVNSYNTELVGVTMHDGGNIMEGSVTNIKDDGLKVFEKDFLSF
ncbi:MAG: hypothetical protein WCJ01_04750 [Ignavibacteria bacterium]